MPNTPIETQTIPARTQIAKPYSELGSNDSTGYKLPISLLTAAAYISPPQRIPRSEEVESRGWRRGAPQSPSPSSFGAPQGNNKIYTYDVVFSSGEARKKFQGITPIPYKQHRKSADCKSIVACTASTPKPRGAVLDATASSYLPRHT